MKAIQNVPFWLLTSYLGLLFYRAPQVSDSIIIIGLAALYGYVLLVDFKRDFSIKNPETDPELIALAQEFERERLKLQIHDVKTDAHKRSLNNIGARNDKKVSF